MSNVKGKLHLCYISIHALGKATACEKLVLSLLWKI